MANRLGHVLLLTVFAGSVLVSACGDDDPSTGGGEAGDTASSGSPGDAGSGGSGTSGSGGSTASGSSAGGQAGGQSEAGAGQAGDIGLGGQVGSGGTGEAGGPVSEGGAGGSAEPEVVYACGQTTIAHKFCSAGASLNCADQPECPDCVATVATDRDAFTQCDACLAAYDKALNCGIDPFEQGDASGGLACVEEYGADLNDACFPLLLSAFSCTDYPGTHDDQCPTKWPLDE